MFVWHGRNGNISMAGRPSHGIRYEGRRVVGQGSNLLTKQPVPCTSMLQALCGPGCFADRASVKSTQPPSSY